MVQRARKMISFQVTGAGDACAMLDSKESTGGKEHTGIHTVVSERPIITTFYQGWARPVGIRGISIVECIRTIGGVFCRQSF